MCSSPAGSSTRQTPLWLSHHWPEHYDRCVRIGRSHVCRRCLVLYPLTIATIVAVAVLDLPFGTGAIAAMWLLPLPMVLEWLAEHTDRAAYSPVRQMLLAALAAPALGIALAEHLRRPFTPAAVAPIVVYGAICLLSAWWATSRRPRTRPGWESEHESAEAARLEELRGLLAESPGDAGGAHAPQALHHRAVDPATGDGR